MGTQARPHVWGIGLTRTGTNSLTRSLEILGYNVVHYPTIHSLLCDPIEAATDEPVAATYKYLDYLYPGSKFIFTEREERSWLESTAAHRDRHFARLRQWSPTDSPFPGGSDSVHAQTAAILGQSLARDRAVERVFTQMALYETVAFDEEKFRQGYRRHREDVARYFAARPDDLLRFGICAGEGWEPLCAFLGCPVPDVPFPRVGTRPEARGPEAQKHVRPGVLQRLTALGSRR